MSKGKLLKGVFIGAILGAVGGLFLAPKSGKQLRKDAKARLADFYKFAEPRLKTLKNIGEKEYKAFMKAAAESYARARRFSKEEARELASGAAKSWKHVVKIAKHSKK